MRPGTELRTPYYTEPQRAAIQRISLRLRAYSRGVGELTSTIEACARLAAEGDLPINDAFDLIVAHLPAVEPRTICDLLLAAFVIFPPRRDGGRP